MTVGVSSLQRPNQASPSYSLELDNSYFLVQLQDAQIFDPAGWLSSPQAAIFSSSVSSTFRPDEPTKSLHQISVIQKNLPVQTGLNINLTDWLPSRTSDSVTIDITCSIVENAPIKAVVKTINQGDLAAKISLLRPDLAVAFKVTEIAGGLLSSILNEGGQTDTINMKLDLNVSELKAGYYAVIGSKTDEIWPTQLQVDGVGKLSGTNGEDLSRFSYVVIKVLTIPRRGPEIVRGEAWGELLATAKQQALETLPVDDTERRRALMDWRASLRQIRALVQKESGFLLREIDEAIAEAQSEVEERLVTSQSQSTEPQEYPDDLKRLLNADSPTEIASLAASYKHALGISADLIVEYKSNGFREQVDGRSNAGNTAGT